MSKRPIMISLKDGVSGITVFPDGSRLYWTEGRSSSCVLVKDGKREEFPVFGTHPILAVQRELEESGDYDVRPSTPSDEREWAEYG